MESLLIRERYKVVRVISLRRGYALLEAVDISERETPSRLLNLYEGEHLRRYAKRRIPVPALLRMCRKMLLLLSLGNTTTGISPPMAH